MAIALWVGPPRSYTWGRPRPIQYIVVHYTAGSEGPNSAEAGAAYDKVRTDGTSTHVFVDSNTVVREVWDQDQAHAARRIGNRIGLQMELCGTVQTREQWLDKYSLPTLKLGAKQCAEWCRQWDIPVRRLSVAETRAAWYGPEGQRPKGFVGHVDVTEAYPEDNGDHTDPGPQFPWDVFLDLVRAELGEEDDMTPEEHAMLQSIQDFSISTGFRAAAEQQGTDTVTGGPEANQTHWLVQAVKQLQAAVAAIGTPTVDTAALAAALIAEPAFADMLKQQSFEGAQQAERE